MKQSLTNMEAMTRLVEQPPEIADRPALLAMGGAYASMWQRQRRAAERESALARVAE